MAPRSTRGRGVRALLVGVVFTLGAVSLAAQAGPGDAPVMKPGTLSVASGWSKSNKVVGVEFNKKLAASSTAVVTDLKTGLVVPGQPVFGDSDPIAPGVQPGPGIAFVATNTMASDGRNYEVKFTVSGSEGTPDTIVQKIFKVDTLVPVPPRITSPSGTTISVPCGNCMDTTTTISLEPAEAIAGTAADQEDKNALEPAAGTSGIAAVELRFYNVVDQAFGAVFNNLPPDPDHLNDASDAAFRITLTQACGATCPGTVDEWSQALGDLDQLDSGVWSVRAVAIDLAGNQSAPSKTVTFFVS